MGLTPLLATVTMSDAEKQSTTDKKGSVEVNAVLVHRQHHHGPTDESDIGALRHADNVLLAKLGYKSEFRREFSVRIHYHGIHYRAHVHVMSCSALRRSLSRSLLWE